MVPSSMSTPEPVLKAIVLLAPGIVPPIVLPAGVPAGLPRMLTPSPLLPRGRTPLISGPMKLPCTRFPLSPAIFAVALPIRTPEPPLPEMMLRAAALFPPIVLLAAP